MHTPIGDSFIERLSSNRNLEELRVMDTHVTDACVKYLLLMPKLKFLYVDPGKFSDESIQLLEKKGVRITNYYAY